CALRVVEAAHQERWIILPQPILIGNGQRLAAMKKDPLHAVRVAAERAVHLAHAREVLEALLLAGGHSCIDERPSVRTGAGSGRGSEPVPGGAEPGPHHSP